MARCYSAHRSLLIAIAAACWMSLSGTAAFSEENLTPASSTSTLADRYPADAGLAGDPSVLFFEDFESGDFAKWDDYDGNAAPGSVLLEAPGPAGGESNHVARLRAPEGRRSSGSDLVKVLGQGHDRLYARWYVQYEPGFNFRAPNHGSGLHAGSRELIGRSHYRPNGSDWFSSWIEYTTDTHQPSAYTYYRGMYQDCANPRGRCWGDRFPAPATGRYAGKPHHVAQRQAPALQAGVWYCLEMMMDGGTPTETEERADGVLNFWVDGVEIGPFTGLWLRTTNDLKLNALWLSLFHHDGSHSVGGILLDNVVIATERIGTLTLKQ